MATLRVVKKSPYFIKWIKNTGAASHNCVIGTRLSEHPIAKAYGTCLLAWILKNSGLTFFTDLFHALFCLTIVLMIFVLICDMLMLRLTSKNAN